MARSGSSTEVRETLAAVEWAAKHAVLRKVHVDMPAPAVVLHEPSGQISERRVCWQALAPWISRHVVGHDRQSTALLGNVSDGEDRRLCARGCNGAGGRLPELAVVGLQLSSGIVQCGSILPHGLQDELAVRLQLCHGMLQCVSILPHGLQDELAVRLELCHGIVQRVPRLPHGLQDELAVRSELGRGILQCASIMPRGLQDELAVRLELCHVILQCVSILPHGYQDELAVRRELCRGTASYTPLTLPTKRIV